MDLSILEKYYYDINMDIDDDINYIYGNHKENNTNIIIKYRYSYAYPDLILLAVNDSRIKIIHHTKFNDTLANIIDSKPIRTGYSFISCDKKDIITCTFESLHNYNDIFIMYHDYNFGNPYFFKPLGSNQYLYKSLTLSFSSVIFNIRKLRNDINFVLKDYDYHIISQSDDPFLFFTINFTEEQFKKITSIYEKGNIKAVIRYLKFYNYLWQKRMENL